MITTAEEYAANLAYLKDLNIPATALLLPSTETIYNIDLNKRTIETPEYLSTQLDHFAETIYFKADRYFDNMDLTQTVCLIQYNNENAKNADGNPAGAFAYRVPFYDVQFFKQENKILIPWAIGGPATAAAGDIEFSIRFFKLDQNKEQLIYNLNTVPTKSKILYGMNVITEENENFIIPSTTVEQIYNEINEIRERGVLTWIEAI